MGGIGFALQIVEKQRGGVDKDLEWWYSLDTISSKCSVRRYLQPVGRYLD